MSNTSNFDDSNKCSKVATLIDVEAISIFFYEALSTPLRSLWSPKPKSKTLLWGWWELPLGSDYIELAKNKSNAESNLWLGYFNHLCQNNVSKWASYSRQAQMSNSIHYGAIKLSSYSNSSEIFFNHEVKFGRLGVSRISHIAEPRVGR